MENFELDEKSLKSGLIGFFLGIAAVLLWQAFMSDDSAEEGAEVTETSQMTFSEIEENKKGDVYILSSGRKYHQPECSSVKKAKGKKKVLKEDAESYGYTPCSRCNKE